MNDPPQVPFPYKRPVIKVNQVGRKMKLKEGIKRPIEKYGWISEGKLKPIEKGLPLIFGSKISHAFEDIEASHKRFTDFVEQYKKFKTGDEFDDSIDNDENEENANQEEEDEIEISYNPFKFLIDKVAAENETTEYSQDHQTGISTASSPEKKDYNASIIKSISPIKFSSVKPSHEIKKPLYMSPFYHPQFEPKTKFTSKSTVPLLQQQLKRVFKPDSAPFENVDKSEDFPTTMLLPMIDETTQNKRGKSELSILRKKNRIINPKNDKKATKKIESNTKKVSFPDDGSSTLMITEMKPDMYSKDTFIDFEDQNNKEKEDNNSTSDKVQNKYDDLKGVPSTLIDPTKEDIFWTKNKTPYTREDINHIFSWQMQNDAIMTMIDEKRQKKLDDRQKALMTTFESKEAFSHAIDLVDKECERIVKLGPGKSERNKKSFWIEAAKYAKNDKSSLMYRKKKWDEFIREIQNSFKLLIKQNKDENKDDYFYSSPYFSSISNSNANLNVNLAASSSKSLTISNHESKDNLEVENDTNEQNGEDVYSSNLMIGNQPKNNDDEKCNGLMKNQVDFILHYKEAIMSGKEVNSSTFWKVIEPFQAVDFTHTEFCILVEILRSQLGVTKSEVHTYLDDKGFPTLFYHLASTSPDFQPITEESDFNEKMNKKKKKTLIEENKSLVFDVMQKKQKLLEKSPPHK